MATLCLADEVAVVTVAGVGSAVVFNTPFGAVSARWIGPGVASNGGEGKIYKYCYAKKCYTKVFESIETNKDFTTNNNGSFKNHICYTLPSIGYGTEGSAIYTFLL